MGNRVSNLWCTKTNLAIKDKESSEYSKAKRESKRRFRQRRLSLSCITREADSNKNKNSKEPVLVHKPSALLPRHSKLLEKEKSTEPELEDNKEEVPQAIKITEKVSTLAISNENTTSPSPSTTNKSLHTIATLPHVENPLESVKQVPFQSLRNTFSSPINSSIAGNSTNISSSASLSSTPAKKFSTATLDVVDSPIRVLATTRTEDILTREKLTCSVSSLKTSTMKFNTDLTTTTTSSTAKVRFVCFITGLPHDFFSLLFTFLLKT